MTLWKGHLTPPPPNGLQPTDWQLLAYIMHLMAMAEAEPVVNAGFPNQVIRLDLRPFARDNEGHYSVCKPPLGHHLLLLSSEDSPTPTLYPKTLDLPSQWWTHFPAFNWNFLGHLQGHMSHLSWFQQPTIPEHYLTNTCLSVAEGLTSILFYRDLANIMNFIIMYHMQSMRTKRDSLSVL